MDIKETVVITGAASGIGKAIAEVLANASYRLALIDKNKKALDSTVRDLLISFKSIIIGKSVDLSNCAQTQLVFDEIHEHYGQINHVIACTGNADTGFRVEDLPLDRWKKVVRNNVSSIWITIKASQEYLKRTEGSIVIMASVSGNREIHRPSIGHIHYKTSKSALLAFGKSLASELAIQSIRVNIISPGGVPKTDLFRNIRPLQPILLENPIKLPLLTKGIPLEPEKVAKAVAFLMSKKADFISGTELVIDGADSLI